MSHLPSSLTKPYIANEIGNYFDENNNETARLFAHAALGAASAYLSGNDATSGSLGAASGEAIAILVQKELYGDKLSNELTQQEKETIRAVATLASGLVGAMSGGSFEDSAIAAAAGYNAAVNNTLSEEEIALRDFRIANCHGDQGCIFLEKAKFDILSANNDMKNIGNGAVNIWNGLSDDIPPAYNNAHPAAQYSLSAALTISEFGVGKIFPIIIQVPYDLYSGSNFITLPTSSTGWIGYSLSGTAE